MRISLVYLPDFSEEYAIDVRSGLGIANVGIKLEDGWNLTEISQELDSQADENVKAFASLLSAVGEVVPTAGSQSAAPEVSFTVAARNVPIGFYESIIGSDARCCKRLYGFRYIGFVPFAGCPIDMSGQQSACCNDPNTGLYGLSYIDGQMLFLPLDQLAHLPANIAGLPDGSPASQTVPSVGAGPALPHAPQLLSGDVSSGEELSGAASTAIGRLAPPMALPLTTEQLVSLEVNLQAHLTSHFDGVGEVRATGSGDRTRVHVIVPAGLPPLPIQHVALQWLKSQYGAERHIDLILSP